MKTIQLAAIAAVTSVLCACGGGGGDTPTPPPPQAGATTYDFHTPQPGAIDTFSLVVVDDTDNTINGQFQEQVVAVNPDGSYVLRKWDPTGASTTVNGVLYHYDDTTLQFSARGGETSYVATTASGTTASCTIALTSGGRTMPTFVGQAWTVADAITCAGGGSETSTTDGSVVALETITVAAGTFTALKTQSHYVADTAAGEHIDETITRWVDPAHSLFTLKEVETIAVSGNAPAHHPVTRTTELTGRSS